MCVCAVCVNVCVSRSVSLTSVCVMNLWDLCVSLLHAVAVALWYTLAMYLDGTGCKFEYVRIRVCAAVYGLVWESSRARACCFYMFVFVHVCVSHSVSLTVVCVMILCALCVSFTCGVVALWYTLAIYLDGAGTSEFEYVRIRVCAVVYDVWVGMGELVRACVLCLCVCVNVCVSLTLSL